MRAFQPQLTIELSAGPHKIVVEDLQNSAIGGHLRLAFVDPLKVVNPSAIELAAKADAVIVAVGYQTESEGEGGDRTFALPYGQDELIEAMTAANKKTIVNITSGCNVDSTAWIDNVPALLESWYGGQAGGTALAEFCLASQILPAICRRPLSVARKIIPLTVITILRLTQRR